MSAIVTTPTQLSRDEEIPGTPPRVPGFLQLNDDNQETPDTRLFDSPTSVELGPGLELGPLQVFDNQPVNRQLNFD